MASFKGFSYLQPVCRRWDLNPYLRKYFAALFQLDHSGIFSFYFLCYYYNINFLIYQIKKIFTKNR